MVLMGRHFFVLNKTDEVDHALCAYYVQSEIIFFRLGSRQ